MPMTAATAYQRARALWPDRLVVAVQFADQCKIGWSWGVQTRSYYGRTFEEAFRGAGVQL